MADGLRKHSPLRFDHQKAENWRVFSMEFDIYMEAMYADKSDRAKAMILLNLAGGEAIELERSFVYSDEIKVDGVVTQAKESRYDPKCLLEKFRNICEPKRNTIMERHTFNSRFQQPEEDIQKFIADLRTLASTCEFGALKDEFVRDRIVCGITSDSARFLLLKESKLTLDKAIDICMLNERSKAHNDKFKSKTSEAHEVKSQKWKKKKKHVPKKQEKCDQCGYEHRGEHCPAKGQQCLKCKGWNHFKSCCRSGRQGKPHKKVYEIAQSSESSSEYSEGDGFVMDTIEVDAVKSEIYATLTVNDNKIEGKIDTGAKCNVMSTETFNRVKKGEQLDSTNKIKLIAFGGSTFTTEGTAVLSCVTSKHGEPYKLIFHVLSKKVHTLIGLKDAMNMKLVSINEQEVHEVGSQSSLLVEYSDVFDDEVGKLPIVYKMKIKPDIKPVVMPPRPLPIAVKERVKHELDDMENKKIIAKVDKPTEWVSALVASKKKDKDEIHICIDPQNLNRAIERPHHPMKTIEQVVAEIPGAAHFTALDAKTGFWQICLDEKSYHTTFQIPFGRYQFQ